MSKPDSKWLGSSEADKICFGLGVAVGVTCFERGRGVWIVLTFGWGLLLVAMVCLSWLLQATLKTAVKTVRADISRICDIDDEYWRIITYNFIRQECE
ncbi:MAG: hypothetical protein HC908_14450 [Calothrix sp. SM1_7_51]|nr:hypothetical protein [Calothrix sp. SM1_7_51]